MKTNTTDTRPTPGVREDRKTGQYVPTLDGKDLSPTSFDEARAMEIAEQAAAARPLIERLPRPGQVVITAEQSRLKDQIRDEALTVARETNRTPRQLADERAELIAALKLVVNNANREVIQADPRRRTEATNTITYARELLTRLAP